MCSEFAFYPKFDCVLIAELVLVIVNDCGKVATAVLIV